MHSSRCCSSRSSSCGCTNDRYLNRFHASDERPRVVEGGYVSKNTFCEWMSPMEAGSVMNVT